MKTFIIILFLVFFVGIPAAHHLSQEEIQITVVKTERVSNKESSRYLIFTENETFENTDSWMFLKFDSSDLYGQLKTDSTYNVKVAGWRIKMLSSYRNIISIQ